MVVSDQLDSDLDWTSFELTGMGFGDQLIAVPENSQHFETTAAMSYNGVDFEVQIEAGIPWRPGGVCRSRRSPQHRSAARPPVGFLPPEDGTSRGQGHISYLVLPKAAATGTEIRNVA